MNKVIFTTGSMTMAQKGKKVLASSSVDSVIVNLDSSRTKRGCAYGIEDFQKDYFRAQSILDQKGIIYSEIIKA